MLRMMDTENVTKKPNKRLSPGQKVSKKYRRAMKKKLQQQELRRLQAVLPNMALMDRVDDVEVVEEAIKYIDALHTQLLVKMMGGLSPFSMKFLSAEMSNPLR